MMTNSGFLSKIRLKRSASVQSIAQLLVPHGATQQYQAGHHLLWSVFGDDPERRRDFLWRQIEPGEFITLSERPAENAHDLFDIDSKEFNVSFKKGDKLHFVLRVNATVDRPLHSGLKNGQDQKGKKIKSKRHDVVMDALKDLRTEERSEKRAKVTHEALENWLKKRAEQSGFTLEDGAFLVENYNVHRLPRPNGTKVSFGMADLTGRLEVQDPELFTKRLKDGFGRAKAFGCGLMLVRRVL